MKTISDRPPWGYCGGLVAFVGKFRKNPEIVSVLFVYGKKSHFGFLEIDSCPSKTKEPIKKHCGVLEI